MNEDIKLKWVSALRSGRYRQTFEQLRDDVGYCCLGVLCDVIDPSQWDGESYLGAKTSLPRLVVRLADVDDCNPEVSAKCLECDGTGQYNDADHREGSKVDCTWCGGEGQITYRLADLNDERRSFEVIAGLIEEQL